MTARKALLFFALVFTTSCLGWCDNCTVGSLETYTAAEFSCTVGNLTYSDFHYTGTSTAADAITAGEVTVVPAVGEIIFKASWDVGAGQSLNSDISYVVSGDDAVITGLKLSLGGWGFLEGGALSATDTGTTDPVGWSSLRFAQFGGLSVTYIPNFSPVSSFSMTEDVSLTGNNGAASIAYVATDWTIASTTTPEPPTMPLAGVGLVGLAMLARRRYARRQES